VHWWGPQGVTCPTAEVDLRVGGAFRLANRFPDGSVLWIAGVFEVIERPDRLVYTWELERVTVSFVRCAEATEVIVTHERIADAAALKGHEQGWEGCLDGLAQYAIRCSAPSGGSTA
jgi:uncharacterized protein YndB with AHSA1/START domain